MLILFLYFSIITLYPGGSSFTTGGGEGGDDGVEDTSVVVVSKLGRLTGCFLFSREGREESRDREGCEEDCVDVGVIGRDGMTNLGEDSTDSDSRRGEGGCLIVRGVEGAEEVEGIEGEGGAESELDSLILELELRSTRVLLGPTVFGVDCCVCTYN